MTSLAMPIPLIRYLNFGFFFSLPVSRFCPVHFCKIYSSDYVLRRSRSTSLLVSA
jgi:hypothetical protein